MDIYKQGRKIFWVGIIVLILLAIFIAMPRKASLQGRWEPIEGHSCQLEFLEFFKNGTYVSGHSNYEGRYSAEGNRLMLQGVLVDSRIYTYEINGNEMTLYKSDGDIYCIFEKVTD